MTFIPGPNKYRHFEFLEGDSDEVGTNTWDCPTCVRSMPSMVGAKKGDVFECKNCGCRMVVDRESMPLPTTTVRMLQQGEEPRWRIAIVYDDGRKLLL